MLHVTHTHFKKKTHDNALVYLVQNKKFTMKNQFGFARENVLQRMDLFHLSLSYFVDHFHPDDDPPDIHVFHEGDVTTEQAMRASKVGQNFPLYFHTIQFEFPRWLSKSEIEESIHDSDIPGWRDMGYRHMCRFYTLLLYPKLIEWGYKKMMRLDDDSFPLETLPLLFRSVSPEQPYMARLLQNEGETFRRFYYPFLAKFCATKKLSLPPEDDPDFFIVPFNNFFIVDLSLYERPLVKEYLHYMDRTGGIYKYRWGDALLQGMMIKYVCGITDIPLFTFRYSKWGLEFEEDIDQLELYKDTVQTTTVRSGGGVALVIVLVIFVTLIIFFSLIKK